MKSWLQDNDIEMYSKHTERKCVVTERFVRTFNTKIYKYMTSISKKLDNIVDEYNNTYNNTIKMKLADVKWSTYIDFGKDSKLF